MTNEIKAPSYGAEKKMSSTAKSQPNISLQIFLSTVQTVKLANGECTKDALSTLHAIRDFYQTLFTNQQLCEPSQHAYLNCLEKTLPPTSAESLEKPITHQELAETLTEMASNKAPGIDGLPKKFYETFWPEFVILTTILPKQTRNYHTHTQER